MRHKNYKLQKWGTIKIDFDTMETNIKGVFAAGDIVRGASLVFGQLKMVEMLLYQSSLILENIRIKKNLKVA